MSNMFDKIHKENILKLKDGETYTVPESDYGHCDILLENNKYSLFEIPQFGGETHFVDYYRLDQIDEMIKEYQCWT